MTETNLTNNATFQYPDSAVLYKRKTDCGMCEYPVWAHVQTETDDYFLTCGCGDTNVRGRFHFVKPAFVYAEQGDI